MNLPFVLDIAIGLIFIYIVLSLLASEVQELIATLFQWRAKHLKNSIKNLLEGGEGTEEKEKVEKLVNELYHHPLLENVNQQARGFVEKAFRSIGWFLSDLYRPIANKKNKEEGIFGDKRSAPSYINSEIFTSTLMETLKISVLSEVLVESRIKAFAERIASEIKNIAKTTDINLDNDEHFQLFDRQLSEIIKDFQDHKASLNTSIERMSESLDRYIQSETDNDHFKNFNERVKSFKIGIFGEKNERAIISGGLQPTITEIIDSLNTTSKIHQEIEATLSARDSETYKKIKNLFEELPQSIQASLAILARRAKAKVQTTENEIHQLSKEISIWFDRSMERASGVYKRNAKGVALLIGLVIAFAINADTIHIFNRLSNDDDIRHVITERASQIALNSSNEETIDSATLDKIKVETNLALKDISLPIGWNPINLNQQLNCNSIDRVDSTYSSFTSDSQGWNLFFDRCLNIQQNSTTLLVIEKIFKMIGAYPLAALKMIVGWFLSSIAIAMGAPFWFDLLSKVVNVRNSGSQPPSAANGNINGIEPR